MLKNIKAVLFDLDGTLVDSMWFWESIDIEYLGRYNIELPDDLQDKIEGMSFTETAHYFKETFKIPESIEEIKKTWNDMAWDYYINKVELKTGIINFLDYLSEKDIAMGIGSSNSKDLVNVVIDKYDMGDYFTSIRTSCEVDRGKPFPDIYLKVAKDLGVKPEECLVFEDIPKGIISGKEAGMKVCTIYDDYSKNMDDKKKELADYYINDYNELLSSFSDKKDA
ncbi:HAD family hydrolase [Vallitalea sp.]|jgi:HAD superfamily hydrolase (TIGR01509 family)|uniref:HAD family hydrolase n=1 Tax=Vallitalea sp. TaxID=1882829 RepID=UPI0025F9DAA2|nr:HAD family phosphatase [Vallitalea sp.]MCT4688274.1 HAD family phosphatase [Vallitalea sp.]